MLPVGCRARAGMVNKMGTGVMHKWEERWLVLTKNGKLTYFASEEDVDKGKSRGVIPLGPSWRVAPTWRVDREHCVKVWQQGADATESDFGVVYFLQAASEDEQESWCHAGLRGQGFQGVLDPLADFCPTPYRLSAGD
jgi:hypothetical protein